jgi:hypothetical protein
MFAAIIESLGLKGIAIALAVIALGALLLKVHHDIVVDTQAKDAAAAAAAVKKEDDAMAAKVAAAEHSHDDELTQLRAFRDANPVAPVRLCLGAPAVRKAPAVAGSTSPAPGPVQSVPPGDSGSGAGNSGPNISSLLDAFAARADQVTAELRQRQEIEP